MLEARDVGRAMERLRGDRTQRSVAQRAGINRSSWSSYEAGRRMPNPETYSKIARGLDCDEAGLDRAVLREWQERLRGKGEGESPEWGPTPTASERGAGVLGLTEQEALALLTWGERIQQVLKALLNRQEPHR